MSDSVKVSILMPVFNEDKYIVDAVKSILDFEYKSLQVELIVVDDQSTDNTYGVLRDLKSLYSDIKIYRNESKGKNNALNMAFHYATGQYICLMGGDDLLEPSTLHLRIHELHESHLKGIDDIYTCCKIKTFSVNKKYDSIIIPKDKEKGSTSGGAIAFSKETGNKIFPIPNELPNEDSWIAHYFEFFALERIDIPVVGLFYRIHDNNSHKRGLSFEKFKEQMWARSKSIVLFYSKYHEKLDKDQEKKVLESISLENAIYMKKIIYIIFFTSLSFRKKIVSLTYSSKIFYYIKDFFYKYLAGR